MRFSINTAVVLRQQAISEVVTYEQNKITTETSESKKLYTIRMGISSQMSTIVRISRWLARPLTSCCGIRESKDTKLSRHCSEEFKKINDVVVPVLKSAWKKSHSAAARAPADVTDGFVATDPPLPDVMLILEKLDLLLKNLIGNLVSFSARIIEDFGVECTALSR